LVQPPDGAEENTPHYPPDSHSRPGPAGTVVSPRQPSSPRGAAASVRLSLPIPGSCQRDCGV